MDKATLELMHLASTLRHDLALAERKGDEYAAGAIRGVLLKVMDQLAG